MDDDGSHASSSGVAVEKKAHAAKPRLERREREGALSSGADPIFAPVAVLSRADALGALSDRSLDPIFWRAERLGAESAWWEHVPFAHWVVCATSPRVFVELGTHTGVSYAAFCQGVVRAGLPTYTAPWLKPGTPSPDLPSKGTRPALLGMRRPVPSRRR